jgi:hypothetical protein
MTGLFSFLFKFTRFIIRKLNLKINRDSEVMMAALVSSMALKLAEAKDMNLLKLLIYPRAIESIYSLLVEKGIIKPIKNGETYTHMVVLIFLVYLYIHEPNVMEQSFKRSIDSYMNFTEVED